MATQKIRKELTRHDLALRGLIALVLASLVLTFIWLRSDGTLGGPERVSAHLVDAGGSLTDGADVKLRGVIVGKVSGLRPGPSGGVLVDIAISADNLAEVPANVVARILPATVFGTSFVDLVTPGADAQDALASGAVIPADRRQGTLELQQALDDIDALVKAVGPAELASAIGSAAQALEGRGEELGATIDLATAYLAKLNPRMGAVRADLNKLAATLELAADVAPDLLQATDDALVAARTITEQAAAIATVISGGTALTQRAHRLLSAHQEDLIRFVDNSARLFDIVYANRYAGITQALITNKLLHDRLASATVNGYLVATTDFLLDVPPYYTAADCPRFGAAVGDNCPGSARAGVSGLSQGGAR